MLNLPTCMVDLYILYGIKVGKYTSPMDPPPKDPLVCPIRKRDYPYIPILFGWDVKQPAVTYGKSGGVDRMVWILRAAGPVIQREFQVMLTSD